MKKKVLWAPWRVEYIMGKKELGCIFCNRLKKRSDEKNLILKRARHTSIFLNRYPYNSGHVMIVPYKHTADLKKLAPEVLVEILSLAGEVMNVMKRVLKAQGFNLGMNFGKAAGAGIDDHIHLHIVPRWVGDNNFMPVTANIKTMPQHLNDTYKVLKKGWRKG